MKIFPGLRMLGSAAALCLVASLQTSQAQPDDASAAQTAIFAGGCFWCMEPPFDKLDGVYSTTSGYTGGQVENPTYEQVSAGTTGHFEAVAVRYDPQVIGYETLLSVFWRNIDPVDGGGQFCDRGDQYRSAIFFIGPEQERLARESKRELAAHGRLPGPVATQILEAGEFYPAEEYHQNYYEKNSIRYRFYRWSCGRDDRLDELWPNRP